MGESIAESSFFLHSQDIKAYNEKEEIGQKGATEVRLSNECYNRVLVVEYITVFFSGYGIAIAIMIYECRESLS